MLLRQQPLLSGLSTISSRNSRATSASNNRCRFLANTEWSKPWSMMFRSRNHLNSRSYPSRSQNGRSLRTENSAISRQAFSRCSGGIDARPSWAYIRSKVGESWARAWSTMGLMRRMG